MYTRNDIRNVINVAEATLGFRITVVGTSLDKIIDNPDFTHVQLRVDLPEQDEPKIVFSFPVRTAVFPFPFLPQEDDPDTFHELLPIMIQRLNVHACHALCNMSEGVGRDALRTEFRNLLNISQES